ncbi:TonB-dependent receptor domain-containing protein [Pontibacter silvestris]|uniref:TonB-dependent receptor domain-containing protein n=1 Tax=Pontibacter silvestris TaxID=2305183 RepID=A0ABW4X0P8_9BACT|nr:TonB-dependent receptor [Pontibacter silvestris]MCC9136063.1 TonB-dependent receptor [Pontibacter silvestris]
MRKSYTSLLMLFCMLSISLSSFAQTAGMLSGTLIDEKEQAVGFANVAVVQAASSSVVTGAIADMDGHFEIKAPAKGKYYLKLSGLGYEQTQTEPFEVTDEKFAKNFGTLRLKTDAKTLSEVTVQAMRPTITTHPDKMVVSVEGTALAGGSTAYEVLEKSPGVWIDQDGNIKLNGKAGVQIMINGKQSYLSGKDLQNLLQSMSAENIKDLEVITNPSSKYDAEGASGIININLKKNIDFGLNGSVYAGYQYNKLSTYTSGASANYKNGKWNSSASLDVAKRMRYRDMDMYRVFNNEGRKSYFEQDGYEENERFAPNIRLNTDYDINDKHSVGAQTSLYYSKSDQTFYTDSYLRDFNPRKNVFVRAENGAKGDYFNGTFNLHYMGKLDTTGTTLSADIDYANISSDDDSRFFNKRDSLNYSPPVRVNELLTSTNPTTYSIYSAKVDFTKKLGKTGKLELGAKGSHVTSDNELLFYEVEDTREMLDDKRSNHFIYKENIYAAYANYSTSFGKKWSLQAGLRAEQTESEGYSVTNDETTDRSYLNLFPSVFVQQKVNDNYEIGYKYSRRINRPYYENLNPFIFYLDPYTWAQGNPYLRPQYTNSFELTHTLKQSYNLVLGYSVTEDFIAEVPMQNEEDNTTVFQQQNVDNFENLSATLVAPIKISSKWDMNNNATLTYQRYKNKFNTESVLNDQLSFMANSTQNIQLPAGIKMEINAGYQGPAVYGLYKVEDNWWVDSGFKRSFMNDKLDLSLSFTDIFKSRILVVNTNIEGNINNIDQYQGARSVRVNIRYRFNKGKDFEAKKRDVNLEELNRTGN